MKLVQHFPHPGGAKSEYSRESIWCAKTIEVGNLNAEAYAMLTRLMEKIPSKVKV
jgi:hypothetical protein